MEYKNIVRGAKAQAMGANFEAMFLRRCQELGVASTRFPDGCRQVGAKKLIRVKTPWDWILTSAGRSAFLDTKTTNDPGFPHSKIEEHQITEMLKHEANGSIAGYVIWLRRSDYVIFMAAGALSFYMKQKGSITEMASDAKILGKINSFNPRAVFHKAFEEPIGTA